MPFTTVKKVKARLFRPRTVSRRATFPTALILVVLASLIPSQLLGQSAIPLVNQPLAPTAVAPGAAAFTLTVNGTGFVSGAVVNWNGSPRVTTFVSSQQVTAAILATDVATAQTATITVTNPVPGGGTSNPVLMPVTKPTTGTFMVRNDITVNKTALAIAAGDFRSNGKTDLAVANSANSVDVLLGNGDGTFQPAVNYPLATGYPVAIISADVNGDGKADLVVLLRNAKKAAILLGNGDGTFTVGGQFATGTNPAALAAADVNNDGKLDLVVANKGDSTVSVLLGNGDGTFQTQQVYATGAAPDSVAVGDFNGDGLLDLAISDNTDNKVSILLGAGSGTFSAHVDYATAGLPTSVVTADFNGDGKLDLAAASASGNISVLLGKGDGTFGGFTNYPVSLNPQMVAVGDFSGDGTMNLATVNYSNNSVSILQGAGNGTFKAQQIYPTNSTPGGMAVGDFNDDGRLDLAVVDTTAGQLSILTQTPLYISPTFINYEKEQGGFPTPASTVTLRNTGTAAIGIASIVTQGVNAGDFSQTNTCGSSIAAGATCAFSIVFNPQDIGNRTAQIIITESNGSSVGISLYGIGIIRVAIEPDPHNFPTTLLGTSSWPFLATFKNYSQLTTTVNILEFTGLDTQDYVLSNNNCGAAPFQVGPLGTCTMDVTFQPTTKGSRTAALTVFGHFSPGNGQQAILLSGIGTGVAVKPASLTFAAQTVGTTSTAQVVTVKNAYSTALTVSITLQNGNVKDFAISNNTCGTSIPTGATCTVSVTFSPLVTGALSSSLNIGDIDPTGPQVVTLSGTGQ